MHLIHEVCNVVRLVVSGALAGTRQYTSKLEQERVHGLMRKRYMSLASLTAMKQV